MIRLILTSPEGLTIDQLTQEQQQGINSVFAQYVLPMIGTIAYQDKVILDATVGDNFKPEALVQLDLPFTILGQWAWDGVATSLTEITLLDSSFINYLPDTIAEDGTVAPPLLHIPHNFAGWPEVVL